MPHPLREAAADEAGKAAREALAKVLRERADLARDLDGELLKLLQQTAARIAAQLAAAPSDYQQWVLPRLMEGIRRVLDELAASAAVQANNGLRRAWDAGERLVAAPVAAEAAAGAGAAITAAPAAALGVPQLQQLRAMQQFTTGLISGATTDAVNAINRQLGQVVLGAATPFDAIKAVAKLLPDRTSAQVRGIVNTNLAAAFNSAAFAKLKAQAERDPALRKQWRRSGKLHSRDNHDAIDGQVQEVDQPFVVMTKKGPVELMFPADPRAPVGETIHCGCVSLPWKASWKMRNRGAQAPTAQERKAAAAAATAKAKPATRPKAEPSTTTATTTQQRAVAAFAKTGGTWRDVTGQRLVVNEKLFPASIAEPALKKGGTDLASYWAVQTVKRPTEVWQHEHVDTATGEIVRQRLFVKRFEAAGQIWLARAEWRAEGSGADTRWLPAVPYSARPVEGGKPGADAAMTALRTGARVWPRRG